MKLGLLTACLPTWSLEEIARWAAEHGYEALEVAAWPALGDRPFTASHLDVTRIRDGELERAAELVSTYGLTISSLAFYDNNLHPDPDERASINAHLVNCLEAAAALGVPTVGTFIGRNWTRPVKEDLVQAERIFAPIVAKAQDVGVKIVIENCVMEGWHPDGYPGNLAYSPELWEWLFAQGMYLNYDPSHLVWMGIDPVEAIRPYVDHVAHAQAKDIEIFPALRNRYGWPGRAVVRDDPWDVGWWRYRVPGLGQVDWTRVVDVLYEGGFEGVLSVEHEDPVWGGTPPRILTGLEIAHRTLRPLLVA